MEFPIDRRIDSTDTNEYADGDRDETLWEEDLVDTEVPLDDIIPESVNEQGEEARPKYDEKGYRHKPGE